MATWADIIQELTVSAASNGGVPAFDAVRRKYLALLGQHTKRHTIVYFSKFTQPDPRPIGEFVSLSFGDVHGLMEVVYGLKGKALDLVLHCPGGSPEAAEAVVNYLRAKFDDVRVVVPHMAMSAATMIACAADRIVLAKHSSLGPIDPQVIINTALGPMAVPAFAVLDQFAMAQQDCADPKKLTAWLPILPQYGPAFLTQCRNAISLSKALVGGWLARYMFKADTNAAAKAQTVAEWLTDHSKFHSHARSLDAAVCAAKGLTIEPLETDQTYQDLVLSVFHATIGRVP